MANHGGPNEVYSAISSSKGVTKTLAVDFFGSWADDKPLTMTNLSRFVITGITKTKGVANFLVSNIPMCDIPGIYDEYKAVLNAAMLNPLIEQIKTASKAEEKPLPETAKKVCEALRKYPNMGMHKNHPYYEWYNREEITNYCNFLKKNLDKYPKNAEEIESLELILKAPDTFIEKCISRCKESSTDDSRPYNAVIYDSGLKPRSKVDEKGLSLCYQITIEYDSSMRYPFSVTISNLKCKVVRTETGAVNMGLSETFEKQQFKIYLSRTDGEEFFNALKSIHDDFRTTSFLTQLKRATKMSRDQHIARKAAAAGIPGAAIDPTS